MKITRKKYTIRHPRLFLFGWALSALGFLIIVLSDPAKPPQYLRMFAQWAGVLGFTGLALAFYLEFRKQKPKNEDSNA
ncbi:MAG: hypothetical protein COA84_06480 [Robiginitomaculum sp.]|nr:MAG: hypothetical protein COA84_06480 [Robiginitomaculum sp.]